MLGLRPPWLPRPSERWLWLSPGQHSAPRPTALLWPVQSQYGTAFYAGPQPSPKHSSSPPWDSDLSSGTSLLVNSLFFCLDAPKALLASVRRLASTRASFRASLTHFSGTKTSWIAYAKTTREHHVKEIYMYNQIVIIKQTGRAT